MNWSCTLHNRNFHFSTLAEVLAKASKEKTGDQMVRIGAGYLPWKRELILRI